jgi:hypothetical protein
MECELYVHYAKLLLHGHVNMMKYGLGWPNTKNVPFPFFYFVVIQMYEQQL